MNEVTITAAGRVGSGKSALLGEIEILLKALGVPYRYADPKAAQAEKNLTHADWVGELERVKPTVVLAEANPATAAVEDLKFTMAEGLEVRLNMERVRASLDTMLAAARECDLHAAAAHNAAEEARSENQQGAELVARGAELAAKKIAARLRELADA